MGHDPQPTALPDVVALQYPNVPGRDTGPTPPGREWPRRISLRLRRMSVVECVNRTIFGGIEVMSWWEIDGLLSDRIASFRLRDEGVSAPSTPG